MHYVGNNHVAFDTQSLGFPSIKGCQAVCFQVSGGLYGFHDYKGAGGAGVDDAKAHAFASWAEQQGTADITARVALYGVINQEHQYTHDTSGEQDWKAMLLGVARELGFDGPVYGVRVTSHVGKADSLYVRFDRVHDTMRISYKRWTKMERDTKASPLNPDQQALLRPAKSSEVDPRSIAHDTRPYVAESLKDYEYEDVYPVRRKDPGKAENLNIVASKKITQFR
ncbi:MULTISPECIES: hypothetical protein [Paraburkholderia]|uniref:hypothetical protein n=1 Tax=Paraburkholderia TaxID=1822464 RepID=UPI0003705559|nr:MULTISPECIES: hypothetical protein [Paraburkholderia]MDH6146540.1 hypothetical protein [Paraburkholderia sp. WSM4179]